jgi:hypothetical protein
MTPDELSKLIQTESAESERIEADYERIMRETPDPEPATDSRLNELFAKYAKAKAEHDRLEMALDKINEEIEPVKEEIIQLMSELEYQSVSHSGVKYWLSVQGRPAIMGDKRDAFIDWLREHNEDGIVQRDYINSNTLWGWYNQRSDEEKEDLATKYLRVSETINLNSPNDYKRTRKRR